MSHPKTKTNPHTTTTVRIFKQIFGRGPQSRQNSQYVAAPQLGSGNANTVDKPIPKISNSSKLNHLTSPNLGIFPILDGETSNIISFHPKIWGNDSTQNAFIVGTQKINTFKSATPPNPPSSLSTSTNPRVRSEQKKSGILIVSRKFI